jgi:chromosomal replication initiator protein
VKQDFPLEHFFLGKEKGILPQDHTFTKEDLNNIGVVIFDQLRETTSNRKNLEFFERNLVSITLDRQTFFFKVANDFIKSMVGKYFFGELKTALANLVGNDYALEVVALKQDADNFPNKAVLDIIRKERQEIVKNGRGVFPVQDRFKSVRDAKFKIDIRPTEDDIKDRVEAEYIGHMDDENNLAIDYSKTFENFIVGHSNKMTHAVALSVSQNPGSKGKYPSVYIHGPSGLGKTHLLHAIANEVRDNHPALLTCLISAREFMKEMINCMQNNRLEEFQKKYSERVDLLMIDDIHELKNKKGTQNEFFHIFNRLHLNGKQLVFTSDRPPHEIIGIEERIRTRLQWGLVTDMGVPDLETRAAILKRKSKEFDLCLSDEVLLFVASMIRSNIRELEGALIKINAYVTIMKGSVDLESVKKMIVSEDRAIAISDARNNMESITRSICKYFGVNFADVRSKARNKSLATARHMAMLFSQQKTSATLHEIGDFFGNRDHSSVLYGIKKLEKEISENDQLNEDFRELEVRLSN